MHCTHSHVREDSRHSLGIQVGIHLLLVGIGGEHCCILANAVTPLPRVMALSTIEMSTAYQAEHRINRSLSLLSEVAEFFPTVARYSLYTAIDISATKVMNRVFITPDVL